MKRFLSCVVIVTILFIIFCCYYFSNESPYYIKLAHQIRAQTAKKLQEEKGLVPIGFGGQMMDDIQMMMLAFQFYKVVDIDTARQLLVDSVEEFLSEINTNEQVRPYLHNYPFTAENVEIEIYFRNSDGYSVRLGEISSAAAEHEKITYYTHSPDNTLIHFHEETYEDAVKALKHD